MLLGDGLSTVLEMLALVDIVHVRAACVTWSNNPLGQKSVHLGRIADLLVDGIKKTQHHVRVGSENPGSSLGSQPDQEDLPTVVVDEQMDSRKFELLFGRQVGIRRPDCSVHPVEVVLKRPSDVLAAVPGLPLAVYDVLSNAPTLPLCPLRCWAGYADGHVRYDPCGSRFTLRVRSKVLKLCGYWEKSLDTGLLRDYLEA